jgi:hypothetical protein|tara:strand:+ start:639 stop:956 length:318 start_codon:yes stop_codon:yes gene_type:complete
MEVEIKQTNLNKIKTILNANPDAKNSDLLLMAIIWKDEIEKNEIKSIEDFLYFLVYSKDITHFESIRRTRCKLQSENPLYRGSKYYERINKIEEIQGDLNALNTL